MACLGKTLPATCRPNVSAESEAQSLPTSCFSCPLFPFRITHEPARLRFSVNLLPLLACSPSSGDVRGCAPKWSRSPSEPTSPPRIGSQLLLRLQIPQLQSRVV